MEIKLLRFQFSDQSSIGELWLGDQFECYTLEDKDRGLRDHMDSRSIKNVKVYGKTAIPYGRYEVIVSWSNKFRQYMPLIVGVKGFSGIRIHSGNRPEHTEGCPLLGSSYKKDWVSGSKTAYRKFFSKINRAVKREKVFIEIAELREHV